MYTYEMDKLATADRNVNVFRAWGDVIVHTHDFVEMVYVTSGHCVHYIDDVPYESGPGDMVLISYGQTHRITDVDGAQYVNIEYQPDFFGRELMHVESLSDMFAYLLLEDSMEEAYGVRFVHFPPEEAEGISALLTQMCAELQGRQPGYRTILSGYSRVLFSRILRRALRDAMPDESTVHRIVTECRQYIDQNYFEKLTLGEIAKNTSYSPAYLSRIFKKYGGRNLWEYIREKRSEEAARLLRETGLSVDEVMAQVGYTDRKGFYRDFDTYYHCTPARYRKSQKSL